MAEPRLRAADLSMETATGQWSWPTEMDGPPAKAAAAAPTIARVYSAGCMCLDIHDNVGPLMLAETQSVLQTASKHAIQCISLRFCKALTSA